MPHANFGMRSTPPVAACDWALFFDLDGTLIDIADSPDRVDVPADLPVLLRQARDALGGCVALLSGRSIADLDRLLAPENFCAAGLHGAEIRLRPHGHIRRCAVPRWRSPLRREFMIIAEKNPGVWLEDKELCLTLHYRARPELGALLAEGVQIAVQEYADTIEVVFGRKVLEIREKSFNKGRALKRIMHQADWSGRRPLVFGDDVTDEDAFRAVRELSGIAIAVGPVAKNADYVFERPVDVRDWLRESFGPHIVGWQL